MKLVAGLPLPGDPNRDAVGWWGCGLWPQGLGRKGAVEVTPQGAGPWVLGPGTKWGREKSERPNRSLSFLRIEEVSEYFRRRGREEGRVDKGVCSWVGWKKVQESRLECLFWASLFPDPHSILAPSLNA